MLILNGVEQSARGTTGSGDLPPNTVDYATLRGVGGEWMESTVLKTYSDHILASEVRSSGKIISGTGNVEVTSAAGEVQLEAIENSGAVDNELLIWDASADSWIPSDTIDGGTF